jgi:hypothetical protein
MAYVDPKEVISPKAHWHLFDVILDRKEGDCAYALGTWDGERRIGFRWNGDSKTGPLGNPQSRGLPTWTMLDPALHEAIVGLLSADKQSLAKNFLGLRTSAERRSVMASIRAFHEERTAKIKSTSPPVDTLGGGLLVMHVVPFTSVEAQQVTGSGNIFRDPHKFPPIGTDHARDSSIDYEGLLTGSNNDGLGKPQRAYVRVFRGGQIESVVSSIARGHDRNFIELPHIQAIIIQYARFYAGSLRSIGVLPPFAILVSLLQTKGMRLVQDFISGALPEGLPFRPMVDDKLYFGEIIFEDVPVDDNQSARFLDPILSLLANASGLPSSPYFNANGDYVLHFKVGLD